MNKLILTALVATAFAQEKCATAEELIDSNFAEYKLKYKFDKGDEDDGFTNATSIGVEQDSNRRYITTDGENYDLDHCFIKTGKDTTFKIKGVPAEDSDESGFQIFSENKEWVMAVSHNQEKNTLNGIGMDYYMYVPVYKEMEDYTKGEYQHYTLMTYKDDSFELGNMHSDKTFHPLAVDFKTGTPNQLIQKTGPSWPTKFCFVEVTDLNPEQATKNRDRPTSTKKQCDVDTLSNTLDQLNAMFKVKQYGEGEKVDPGTKFEAICKPGFLQVDSGRYKCGNDGEWSNTCIRCEKNNEDREESTSEYDWNDPTSTKKQCDVDTLSFTLESFDAMFKVPQHGKGKKVDPGTKFEAICKPGYFQVKPVKYKCENDGEWIEPETDIECIENPNVEESENTNALKGANKTCKVDDLWEKITKFTSHSEFKENNCYAGSEINEGETCEAFCNAPAKGKNVKYTCEKNGKFKFIASKTIKCEVDSNFAQIGVLGALVCLFALN